MNKAIIAVLGHDRPGILAKTTRILFQQSCNIENVSQTTLQYEFAGIFIVSMPEDLAMFTLKESLEENLTPHGLHIFIKDFEPGGSAAIPGPSEAFVITTKGPDQKGLVAEFTEVIARSGANVTNLQAVFKGGMDPGDNIMIYEVDIPSDIDQHALYRNLRQKAETLDLDISIQHRKIFEAINRI